MGRIPAVDGLRGIAVLLVIVFHVWRETLPGGGYGVTVFFVLSGFLITRILLRDADGGGVDFKRFYWNRSLRLLPPLALLLLGYVLMGGRLLPVFWTAGYAANIGVIAGQPLGGLTHTWSLAVEEHFYLLWPLIVWAIPPVWRLRTTGGLLGLAMIWRVVMTLTVEMDRVRFGTDTVAFGLLAGCLLSVLHHENRLYVPSERITTLAVGGLVAFALVVPDVTHFIVWGELFVVGLAVIIVAGCLGRVRLLEGKVIGWFGVISYGLYLWHFPLLSLRAPRVVAVGMGVLVAWLSFRYVEQPLRSRFHRSLGPAEQSMVAEGDASARVASNGGRPSGELEQVFG